MHVVRLGIIGCGTMAGVHLRDLSGTRRAKLLAAADVVEARARAVAEAAGAELAVTDYRRMLDAVDAVIVALPHHLHHRAGLDALAAGKHVLMEKPLAVTETECRELIAAARSAGRTLMVGYCMRFDPLVRKFKELLAAGACGEVFQLSIWTEQFTDTRRGDWMGSAEALGGGQLFSHGCHYIDLLLWLLGRPVRGWHLGTNFGTPWMELEGTSHVAIEFADGPVGYHFGTWGAKGSRLRYSFHAHGTEGMLELAYHAGRILAHTPDGEELLFEGAAGKATAAELEHFLDCVATGAEPLTDGPGSLQGLRVIWRLYEAEKRGAVADLRGLGLCEPWERAGP